ncbi:MAG: ribosomal protein L9p [Micavibrio sp.]|nr:ribosomal protein L9p [Micavibrio sp.]
MANMEVILLERVESLGAMGETVRVKPGYARNYLLPQKKALRATNENKAFYEAQRAELEKANAAKRGEAEKLAAKLKDFKAVVVRNAAEGGQLYGSVTTRDIAEAVTAQAKLEVHRTMVMLNAGLKTIGLFPVTLMLHPEVKVDVIVNIARTEEEAKTQAKTGKALIAEDDRAVEAREKAEAAAAKAKAAMMDEEGQAVEKGKADDAEAEAADLAARGEKSEARKAKKAKKAPAEGEAAEAEDAEGNSEE